MEKDHYLIVLAAKAYGVRLRWTETHNGLVPKIEDYYGPDAVWNPLEDDACAFRLAVKLNIMPEIDYEMGYVTAFATIFSVVQEPIGDDALKATRRVIVRTAVLISEAQQSERIDYYV